MLVLTSDEDPDAQWLVVAQLNLGGIALSYRTQDHLGRFF
jgi:hypothetical protein